MPSGEQQTRKTHCPQGHEYSLENTGFRTQRDRDGERVSRHCKTCDRLRMRQKRADPTTGYAERGRLRMARWRERNPEINRERWQKSHTEKKQILDDARKGGCIRCEESHPSCLDFHHRDRATKDADIATMRRFGIPRLIAEIAKCDVLCANCHRKLHWEERNSVAGSVARVE